MGRDANLLGGAGADEGEVGDDLLGVLGLAGAGLAGDQHGLVLALVHHLLVGAVGDGEEVGRHLCDKQIMFNL